MAIISKLYTVGNDYLTPTVYSQHFCTSFYIELYSYRLDGYEINYETTLKGNWINGSIDRDRSSEYCGSCSLELALSDDCIFDCDENYLWENKIIKIIKTYNFLNDKGKKYYHIDAKSPYFYDNSNADVTLSLGYYVVDSSSCKYDQSTRTLSLSGTDIMSIYGSEHGSCLTDFRSDPTVIGNHIIYNPTYITDLVIPAKDEDDKMVDIDGAAQTLINMCSPFELESKYIAMADSFSDDKNSSLGQPDEDGNISYMATEKYIPYDLEFGTEIYLYDPLKKIKDLYEDRIMYMSVKRLKFFMRKMTRSYADLMYSNWIFGRQLTNLVMSENTTVNRSEVYNYYDVYGKESDDGTSQPHNIYRLELTKHPFSIHSIGIHRKVIQDDGCLTNDDCYYTGRWSCVKNIEFKEKTTVVLCDNYITGIFERDGLENLGVGSLIEYTSIHTGETNLYMLNKLSHSFTDGTWTLEMQPFRPLRETGNDIISGVDIPLNGTWKLHAPKIKYEIGENGKVVFTVNNGICTDYSLFKFFIDDKFIGETCTEDGNGNKVFEYQFTENGTYRLYVSAYSAFYEPNDGTKVIITIDNIDSAILTDEQNTKLTDEQYNLLTE